MGEAVDLAASSTVDLNALRVRLDRNIVALEQMVAGGAFDAEADTCGFEVELDLVDPLGRPRLVNHLLLAAMDRSDVQAELSTFNLELNMVQRPCRGAVFRGLDEELTRIVAAVTTAAQEWGARAVAIGTLPTLHAEDLTSAHLSANPRYPLLDAAMAGARQRTIHLDIEGVETLRLDTDSIGVQAAATSFQVHLRVLPADFPRFYNAAQLAAAAQVAVGGNSPYLLGRRLWHETRVPLLEQSLDTRAVVGQQPHDTSRAWLGDSWALTATDVLADNVRRFPPLLPVADPADPLEELARGELPSLHELRLHNGTVWRWNRPVYDVQHDHPHLRIENRVLASGPTPADMAANAALFLGLVRAVADLEQPVSQALPFAVIAHDLHAAARDGLDASLVWPAHDGPRVQPAQRLVLDTLLPLAAAGLDSWGVDPADRDRYLGIVADRVAAHRTGADWQTATVEALESRGAPREAALREMVRRYVEHAETGEPVHAWPGPRGVAVRP